MPRTDLLFATLYGLGASTPLSACNTLPAGASLVPLVGPVGLRVHRGGRGRPRRRRRGSRGARGHARLGPKKPRPRQPPRGERGS
eukprot:990943-Pyramimonas_sp.AAC.1